MTNAPFDLTRFHSLLKTKTFGRNLIFEPSVGSTMDLARDAALHGAVEGTLALADEQTAGPRPPWAHVDHTARDESRIDAHPAPARLRTARCRDGRAARGLPRDPGRRRHPRRHQVAERRTDRRQEGRRHPHRGPSPPAPSPPPKGRRGLPSPSPTRGEGESMVLVGSGINVNFDPREHEEIRDIATSLQGRARPRRRPRGAAGVVPRALRAALQRREVRRGDPRPLARAPGDARQGGARDVARRHGRGRRRGRRRRRRAAHSHRGRRPHPRRGGGRDAAGRWAMGWSLVASCSSPRCLYA